MTGFQEPATVLSTQPFLELNNQGRTLKLQLTADQHQLGRDPDRADLVVPPDWQVVSGCHALLRRVGEDYCLYDGDGTTPSTNGLFLNRTRITPNRGYRLKNGVEVRLGQYAHSQIRLTYRNPCSSEAAELPEKRSISLKDRSVMLGRDPDATLELDAPIVSRRHATIEPDGHGHYILRDHSMNGVFVNGQKVEGAIVLPDGATIRIGSFTLVHRGDQLEVLDRGNQIRIDAADLIREVKDKQGKKRRLLDEISLAIEPGQFVALVGGSGAGKSTLMRTLLGIECVNHGAVYLNGDNLRNNFSIYRSQIGYVPQDDIVHRELTVAEVLTYAAQLRLPPDIDVQQVVEKTLDDIEMSDRRDVLVSHLSGGQRKRVSIGVELLADPKLFFLDEPTSGLDPGLDKKMMQLLRKLADQGRTVVLVTHATANITLCDRIVFVGRGGRLCYFGPPRKALEFFEVESGDFADIYNELEKGEVVVQQWAAKFRQSDDCMRYVFEHLSPGNSEKTRTDLHVKRSNVSPFKQLLLLTQRYFQLVWRDPVNLSLALLTAPIGISLINLALGDKKPFVLPEEADPTLAPLALRVLFVFTCAALWVGLSSSLQEIVKESAIYLRERLVNLGLFAYLGSKTIVLSFLAILQTLLMVVVILIGFVDANPMIPWWAGLSITTFLTLIACMSLGLMISAIVRNSSQANSALPLLLLPQIIFSGVLFKMEGFASKISWLTLSRWSIGAYGSLVDVKTMAQKAELPGSPSTFDVEFYRADWDNLALCWGILLVHAAVYMFVTFWMQKQKDIFK
jgi:ABC transport system ATP-binding/permease protein